MLQSPLLADTVVLKDGRVLQGRVTEDKKRSKEIKMDVYYQSMVIPRDSVFSIRKDEAISLFPSSVQKGPYAPTISPEEARKIQEKRYLENDKRGFPKVKK